VIGKNVLEQTPQSYAYRLSPENTPERGQTEYLYERWTDAWERFRQDVQDYASRYQEGIVIKTDIKSYYTRILQDRLGELVRDELRVSKRIEWLIKLLVNKELVDHDPGRGLVQGSIGSGFLANVYLTPLDHLFQVNDKQNRRLFRYVDDVVVVVPDAEDEQSTKEYLFGAIAELHLDPNWDKTDTYGTEEYLALIGPDEKLDRLKERYEQLLDPLWNLDQDLRSAFRRSAEKRRTWWASISRYRSCLTELGLYTTESWLSRKLSTTISKDRDLDVELVFPILPQVATISEAQQWASEFRSSNPTWILEREALKADLEILFAEGFAVIANSRGTVHKSDFDIASRRLRFAVNRLGILGLENVHSELTQLLCETPWLVRDQHRLIADLARQGYSRDIWHLVEFHHRKQREMSTYMNAVALKAVRLLPHLEMSEWEKLVGFVFDGEEIARLMATETWLVLTSALTSSPLEAKVQEQTNAILNMASLPTRRLLKNYLLVLGMTCPERVSALNAFPNSDPLVTTAHNIGSEGSVSDLFLNAEPEILRRKYYSAHYYYDDDGGGASPFG
jgi:hypothetical protein